MARDDGVGASTSPAPDEPDDSFEFVPAPTVAALDACRYERWHSIPELAKHAYGSVTVRLPPEYVRYLLEDGLHLAADSEAMPARVAPQLDERLTSAFTEEDERDDDAIRAGIAHLGGGATPKLTWSAPKDAVWMATGNTTMCRNPGEVLLLLKASDAVAFDLTEAYDCCADVTDAHKARLTKDVALHLRAWRDVRPALEFRLFVLNGDLVAVCQRDCSNFYPFLLDQKASLEETLVLFWQDTVSVTFANASPDCDGSYVLDVYVTSKRNVKIVDFNHWGGGTLPLMFTWAELEAKTLPRTSGIERVSNEAGFVHDAFEFRVVETQGHIRPGAQLGVPFDMVDASPGGALAAFAETQRRAQEKARGGRDDA